MTRNLCLKHVRITHNARCTHTSIGHGCIVRFNQYLPYINSQPFLPREPFTPFTVNFLWINKKSMGGQSNFLAWFVYTETFGQRVKARSSYKYINCLPCMTKFGHGLLDCFVHRVLSRLIFRSQPPVMKHWVRVKGLLEITIPSIVANWIKSCQHVKLDVMTGTRHHS